MKAFRLFFKILHHFAVILYIQSIGVKAEILIREVLPFAYNIFFCPWDLNSLDFIHCNLVDIKLLTNQLDASAKRVNLRAGAQFRYTADIHTYTQTTPLQSGPQHVREGGRIVSEFGPKLPPAQVKLFMNIVICLEWLNMQY